MGQRVDKIAVVGGGSAGWLTAAYLAKHFQCSRKGAVQVTLIESSDVGTIGVGEATIPTIRKTLNFLGIDEPAFMRETSATFKQAIRFDDWLHLPTKENRNSFYHAFQKPMNVRGQNLAAYWILGREKHKKSFLDFAFSQGQVCEAGLGPFNIGDKPGPQGLNYAYHFDAGQFATLLQRYGTERGVVHRIGHVTEVILSEDGSIEKLKVKDAEDLEADLFFDCTGFAGHLIEKTLKSPFLDQTPMLFCDRAVTVQVPYEDERAPIKPFTTSTAKSNGWVWEIGLDKRCGIGHVYSSRHIDDDAAEKVLREYVGPRGDELMPRKLEMRIGYREKPWVKNCIALGLSSGFVEPLESTGINQVEVSLNRMTSMFTRSGDLEFMAENYNKQMTEWYELTFDFIKLHYCTSRRDDTNFWIENRLPETISDRLKHLLEIWKQRPTNLSDIAERRSTFGEVSYHQILFGMDHIPDLKGEEFTYPYTNLADMRAIQNEKRTASDLGRLPPHRDLINKLHSS